MDKGTKKGLIVMLLVFMIICVLIGFDAWMRRKNKFVYEECLDDIVVTVDGRDISLRELGYYVYYVETKIDKQARLYNPEDPLDYWNTYFNSGLEGGYISEMARDAVLGSCVCDLIYEEMAKENGYELTQEEKKNAEALAEVFYNSMTEEQRVTTGLTPEIVTEVEMRRQLVVKFAKEYFEEIDFSGYEGYREELVSYAGDYYQKEILPAHEVKYEDKIVPELQIGRVTTGYFVKY